MAIFINTDKFLWIIINNYKKGDHIRKIGNYIYMFFRSGLNDEGGLFRIF